jgi:hypothetical protein
LSPKLNTTGRALHELVVSEWTKFQNQLEENPRAKKVRDDRKNANANELKEFLDRKKAGESGKEGTGKEAVALQAFIHANLDFFVRII